MKKDKSKKRVEKVKNDSSKGERKEPVEEKAPAEKETTKNEDDEEIITKTTFESLGVHEEICKATLSETGSGKTGAFVIPIFQALLENPQRNAVYAVILAPTRELAFQIHENAAALGGTIGATCVCIVGGEDSASQSIALARNPHIVTATPGRLVYHLTNTKGFSLRKLKYLVMDEADRMLRYVNKQLD